MKPLPELGGHLDNGTNHPKYSRAEREHNEPFESSDGDYDQCEECGGTGETPHNCGEDTCCCLNPKPEKCEECCGDAQIFTPKLTREEYAEKYENDDE